MKYNPSDKDSVITYAKNLRGKTLREACGAALIEHKIVGKGTFGQLLEKYYFEYSLNSESEADFPKAGVELKTTPLKTNKSGNFQSKERLVLNIINFSEIVEQDFFNSSFWKKNQCLLLVFYLSETHKTIIDFVIKIVDKWEFPEADLVQIKHDWETIKSMVAQGKAHELSEGDTLYLAACTKGSAGGNPRKQPFSVHLAKQRAFSLKQKYVNHIVYKLSGTSTDTYGKLIDSLDVVNKLTVEMAVQNKFERFIGRPLDEIEHKLEVILNKDTKAYYANLTKAILGVDLKKEIEEFDKAGIVFKTIRLDEKAMPKEDISFPAFHFNVLVRENWEDSEWKQILDSKFFFVFLQEESGSLVLKKALFWNMPFEDKQQAKLVWEKTKEVISSGKIVREIVNGRRRTNFPNASSNPVAHVRPHAKNANDVYPLPRKDQLTKANVYTKHCFWLNKSYVREAIYLSEGTN